MTLSRWLLLGTILLGLTTAASLWLLRGRLDLPISLGQHSSPAPATIAVATESDRPVTDTPPSAVVVAFGHVDIEQGTVPMALSVPGIVQEVLVTDGQAVRKDQPLIRLATEQAAAQLAQAQAAVHEAEAKLRQASKLPEEHQLLIQQQQQAIIAARSLHTAQKREVERIEPLTQTNVVPTQQFDSAKDRLRGLEASLNAELLKLAQLELQDPQDQIALAESAVQAAKAQADQARDFLDQHSLRAPSDGLTLRVLVAKGEMIGPQRREPVVWFCPDSPRIVRCEIDQEFAARVVPGMTAEIFNDSLAGPRWSGKVLRCADWIAARRSQIDEPFIRNDVRTLECIIAVDPGQPPLRIGQRMRVVIHRPENEPPPTHPVASPNITETSRR